ncbi:cytochrome b561 domain-containing protein 2-like [Anoplophora glabripennis]|uniref:cytochrome b561 domain-containing protein 2-like n=1 Tax=Anoplophora glabripennis TaxID=217634 RepID=UPI000874D2EA|nr:cytochrome b561 domain-containing protein 2-like [Anoplophora glabripennis]
MVTGTYKDRTLNIIDTLFQQLVAVFVLLVLWEVFKNYSLSNVHAWHVILCTIGIGLCMAEGLLLFNKENSFLKDMDRATRGTVHGGVMCAACISLTIGIALKIDQKVQASSNHFTSNHSKIGLTAWILILISAIIGILTANIRRCPGLGKPPLYRIIHLFLGVSAYILGVVALGFGLNYLESLTGANGKIALMVFLALYVAYSLLGPIKSCYNHFFG